MSFEIKMNPNWQRDLMREVDTNLRKIADREQPALDTLCEELQGKPRSEVERELAAFFARSELPIEQVPEEWVDSVVDGHAIKIKITGP
jgi:hypothetical protein